MPQQNNHAVVFDAALSWEQTKLLPLKRAGEIAGLSPSSLYAFQKEGRLVFRRLGGRTLVVTDSLLKLVSEAEEWQPSQRGTAGRAKRIERARAARQD
jgi:hypothetical protein